MFVIATFKGSDGSRGFNHGYEYGLEIISLINGGVLAVARTQGLYCEYASLTAFFKNWDNISTKKGDK